MDNHNDKNSSSVLWMMLPCLLILVFAILAFGRGSLSWPLLVIAGIIVVVYLWIMFRSKHGNGPSDEERDDTIDVKPTSPENSSHVDEKKDYLNHLRSK